MEVGKQQVEDAIESLAISGQLKLEQGQQGQVVYLMPFYYAESSVAARLVELSLLDYDTCDLDMELQFKCYEETKLIV